MSRNQAGDDRSDERSGGPGFVGMPCCPEGMDWSRSGGDMVRACPCANWFRRHRLAAFTALTVVALGFLALQVAWILGVIAFVRTL